MTYAGQNPTSLQDSYDAGTGAVPTILLDNTRNGIIIRDGSPASTPPLFAVQNTAGSDLFRVSATDVQVGRMGASEACLFPVSATKDSIRPLPDDIIDTVVPANLGLIQWDSTYTSNFASARFGGMIYAVGTLELQQAGNPLNVMNLFINQSTIKNVSGVALAYGRSYTIIDGPRLQAEAAACTQAWHQGFRSFPIVEGVSAGTHVVTDVQQLVGGLTINAGGTVTTRRMLDIFSPTGAGTLTNNIGIEIRDQTMGATRRGIRCAMATGQWLETTGVAIGTLAGDLHMNNGVSLVLGSVGANRVELLRPAAGVARIIGVGGTNNEGLDFDMDPAIADTIAVTSSTGAGLGLDLPALSFGTTAADPTSNWFANITARAKTITLAGDFANCLNTAGGNHTIDAALTTFFQWTVNAPAGTLGTGSVTDAGVMLIQTGPGVGTNRYGLLITSNPSGGTLNYAFRQSNASALARFDGRLDINRGIALGAGGAATLGLTGGAGPTATAQAQWLEIDIGGVAHWIPAWT